MILSILIPTTPARAEFLARLMAILTLMTCDRVEVVTTTAIPGESIGSTRNRLLLMAAGDYVCFVDDDDIVPPYYIEQTLLAIKSKPDCVGWCMGIWFDGVLGGFATHSITVSEYRKDTSGPYTHYYRSPNHLNAVRRELALECMFPDVSIGEDSEYGLRLQPKLKSEVFINALMYEYRCLSQDRRPR